MDKLELVFAVLKRLAQAADDSELVEYLDHGSHHSDAFLQGVEKHLENLKDLDAFTTRHAEATQPGTPQTFTQAQLDSMIKDAVANALAARGGK